MYMCVKGGMQCLNAWVCASEQSKGLGDLLSKMELRNERFHKALVAYRVYEATTVLSTQSICHFLCNFTLYINTLDSHFFSFYFKLLTVWSSHILPEWRDNKKIGGEVD